ncbi:MAG: methionyl-tRNA formyltransferase [Candidatus Azambacteria bacterium]|nr:methionyl-tRNA formyltransferase [Candidatus Azambacteria bacterium]
MKYIFFGTPKFAEIVLEKLIDAGYLPEAVVCNPDEPVGRKQILTPPPVKSFVRDHETWNIKILQPVKLDASFKFQVPSFKPDLAIVVAYGKIIPEEILSIPRLGFLNVHGSLLPKYRGASPIQSAILNGDKETGITIMKIDEKMDHGKIISSAKIKISNDDNYEILSQKLAICGAELLIKTIPGYLSGKIKPTEQDHSQATYTKIITKEDGKIDWSKSAEEIKRMIRAFYPWPSAWTRVNLKSQISNLKIMEADISDSKGSHKIGEVFLLNSNLAIKCGKSALIIKQLQLEGGKIITAKEFLNGHKDFIGVNLG